MPTWARQGIVVKCTAAIFFLTVDYVISLSEFSSKHKSKIDRRLLSSQISSAYWDGEGTGHEKIFFNEPQPTFLISYKLIPKGLD